MGQIAAGEFEEERARLRRELEAQVREIGSSWLGRLRLHAVRLFGWTVVFFLLFTVGGCFVGPGYDLGSWSDVVLTVVVFGLMSLGFAVVMVVGQRATPRKIWATQLKLARTQAGDEPPIVVPPHLLVPPDLLAAGWARAHPEVLEMSDRALRRQIKQAARLGDRQPGLAIAPSSKFGAAMSELARRGRRV